MVLAPPVELWELRKHRLKRAASGWCFAYLIAKHYRCPILHHPHLDQTTGPGLAAHRWKQSPFRMTQSRVLCRPYLLSKYMSGCYGSTYSLGPLGPSLRAKSAEEPVRWDLFLHQFHRHDRSNHRHFLPGPPGPSCLSTLPTQAPHPLPF